MTQTARPVDSGFETTQKQNNTYSCKDWLLSKDEFKVYIFRVPRESPEVNCSPFTVSANSYLRTFHQQPRGVTKEKVHLYQ